jgi:DNA-binding PadR family transcriptional regulator
MNTKEVKYKILNQLAHIEDESVLNEIMVILGEKAQSGIYHLSDSQKERLNLARNQFQKDDSISDESLQSEIQQWLNSK